jgi:hypothetical protein
MPKPRYQLRTNTISQLLERLQVETGIKLIAHSDAIALAKRIHAKGYQISPHTISRLAGFFTSTTKPYLYNINAIAHFLGYQDVFDFENHLSSGDQQYMHQALNESLLLAAFESNDPKTFVHVFSQFVPLSWPHMRLIQILGIEFRLQSEKSKSFLNAIENDEKSRFLFFHFFVDEDNKGNYFLDAIERIYLMKNVSRQELIFCEEFAMNKYFESGFWGAIPKRRFRKDFEACIKQEHIDSAHLLSRLFVNFIYNRYFSNNLSQKVLKDCLNIGLRHLNEIEHEPFRIAWTGRIVKTFLFIGAEEWMSCNDQLKEEVLRVLKMDTIDYEFQSILQFAALKLGWINTIDLKSYKRDWHSALLASTAWDLMSFSLAHQNDARQKDHLLNQAMSIATITSNVLLQRLIQRIN